MSNTQIEEEKEELKNAPAAKVIYGAVLKCHFCGQPIRNGNIRETVTTKHGKLNRHVCQKCEKK